MRTQYDDNELTTSGEPILNTPHAHRASAMNKIRSNISIGFVF